MKLEVIAHPNSKRPHVDRDLLGTLHVYVNAPPLEGRANSAILEALAEHLKLPKSKLQLIRGQKSKVKTFEIFD